MIFDTIMKSNYIYKKTDVNREITLPEYYFLKLLVIFNCSDQLSIQDIENEFFNFLLDILFPCIDEDNIRNAISCNNEYDDFIESYYDKDLPRNIMNRFRNFLNNGSLFKTNDIHNKIINVLSENSCQSTENNNDMDIEQMKTIFFCLRKNIRWGNEARIRDVNVVSHSLTTSFMMYYFILDNHWYLDEQFATKLFFKTLFHDINEMFIGDIVSSIKHLSKNTERYWNNFEKVFITGKGYEKGTLIRKINCYINISTVDINNLCKLMDYINAFYECKFFLNRAFPCKDIKELKKEILLFYQKTHLNRYITRYKIMKILR